MKRAFGVGLEVGTGVGFGYSWIKEIFSVWSIYMISLGDIIMKARLLTAAIVLWLLSISTVICFFRIINEADIEAAKKRINAVPTVSSEDRDNITFLWHIRPSSVLCSLNTDFIGEGNVNPI